MSVGEELRAIRLASGFGLNEAAGRSQINKATLSQWENGGRTPSGASLDRLLATLRVEPRVRARLLSDADPDYARTALAREPFGPSVDLGQLLRGMRLRRDLTQIELARLCSVGQSSIAAWESGENVPAPESLQAALEILGATEKEIEILRRTPHTKPPAQGEGDLSARLMELHDPRLPVELREPLYILLQRDAWREALQNPAADEVLCRIMIWRGAWYRRMGRIDEGIAQLSQALRLAKALDSVELGGFAAMYMISLQYLGRPPSEQRRFFSIALKWARKPVSPFLRGQLLNTCAEVAYWGRLLRAGEEVAKEARDLLRDHRASLTVHPYSGVEEAISHLSRFKMMQGRPEEAIETLHKIPDFDQIVPLGQPWIVNAYLLALCESESEIPPQALPAVRRLMPETQQVELPYWKKWERFLVSHGKGANPESPTTWPTWEGSLSFD